MDLKINFNVDTVVLKMVIRAHVGIPRGRQIQLSMDVVPTVQIAASKMTKKVKILLLISKSVIRFS